MDVVRSSAHRELLHRIAFQFEEQIEVIFSNIMIETIK